MAVVFAGLAVGVTALRVEAAPVRERRRYREARHEHAKEGSKSEGWYLPRSVFVRADDRFDAMILARSNVAPVTDAGRRHIEALSPGKAGAGDAHVCIGSAFAEHHERAAHADAARRAGVAKV